MACDSVAALSSAANLVCHGYIMPYFSSLSFSLCGFKTVAERIGFGNSNLLGYCFEDAVNQPVANPALGVPARPFDRLHDFRR